MTAPSSSEIAWPSAERQAQFQQWLAPLAAQHGLAMSTLRPASADASFRRYFRIDASGHRSFVVMDAPPPQEDVRPFIDIAGRIQRAGLHAPQVLAADEARGFLLLTDLGSQLYLQALQDGGPQQIDQLMRAAIKALVHWQQQVDASGLPVYDEALLQQEMALFPEWCVAKEFGVTWGETEQKHWAHITRRLADSALAQPQVAVHRDWMPRNLMVCDPNPGILDFQDAVRGPLTYDVASMLRDAFLSWEEEREIDWAARYWEQARKAGLPVPDDFGEFWRQVEWMGLQRHLKVLGIFCRLKHRDGKPKYAEDLPRFFAYATKVARRYRELGPLLPLIEPLSGMRGEIAYSLR